MIVDNNPWAEAARTNAARAVVGAELADRDAPMIGPITYTALLDLRCAALAAGAQGISEALSLAAVTRTHVNGILQAVGQPAVTPAELAEARAELHLDALS